MKHVLRSCLDPLPRILSTRGLAAIVVLVLSGTALSVYEYVESGRMPGRSWPKARTVHAAHDRSGARCANSQRCRIDPSGSAGTSGMPCTSPCGEETSSSAAPQPATSDASLFRPESGTSGS